MAEGDWIEKEEKKKKYSVCEEIEAHYLILMKEKEQLFDSTFSFYVVFFWS